MSETDPLDRQPLGCLVGPTASGKTALALDLCEESGAEVLSLDSMLVYRGLDVGTAFERVTGQGEVMPSFLARSIAAPPSSSSRFRAAISSTS